jgi:plastocyanin
MNKYLIILILLFLIIGAGFGYTKFFRAESARPMETGIVKEYTIISRKLKWRFDPELIEVNRGDRINLTIVNEDDFDHGIAIDAFGVSQRIPAKGIITLSFVATQAGEFTFYCSVPCGDGFVDGVKRGHFDQFGKIIVHSNA